MAFKISQSKIKTWRRCRLQYWYKYVERLRAKRKSRPLTFGSIVHDMLEAHANGDDPFEVLDSISLKDKRLFAEEREYYGEIIDDIRVIMTEYFQYYAEDRIKFVRINKRSAEHQFEVELDNGIILTGKIDNIIRTPNKLLWMRENKTFNQMPNEDHRWRDLQSAIYIRVIDMLGWKSVDGTCWNYIRNKPPTRPQLLKSGKMSERGIDSLPTRVIQTLRENKLDPKKFKHLIESVTNNRSSYFQRIFNPVKKNTIDLLWDDALETAREMEELHGKVKARSIDRHCMWCEFEPICRAELQGSDAEFVKEREFYARPQEETDPEIEAGND